MSTPKTKQDLIAHKKLALSYLEKHIDELIDSTDPKVQSKADKLCFWIKDYSRFLKNESSFDPKKNKKYKRGEIVKAHLGYKLGSEQGGLHYCLVLDNDNPLSSNIITVLPLRSLKPKDDINNLYKMEIFLGNELFNKLSSKANNNLLVIKNKIDLVKNSSKYNCEDYVEKINSLTSSLNETNRILTEIKNMKKGSIALISQITTISKLRIYDPKTTGDVLNGVKLSNENLNAIDNAILENYTKK